MWELEGTSETISSNTVIYPVVSWKARNEQSTIPVCRQKPLWVSQPWRCLNRFWSYLYFPGYHFHKSAPHCGRSKMGRTQLHSTTCETRFWAALGLPIGSAGEPSTHGGGLPPTWGAVGCAEIRRAGRAGPAWPGLQQCSWWCSWSGTATRQSHKSPVKWLARRRTQRLTQRGHECIWWLLLNFQPCAQVTGLYFSTTWGAIQWSVKIQVRESCLAFEAFPTLSCLERYWVPCQWGR